MPLTPGARVGAYEVVSPLGAGGMGEVYRARDARLQRDVAIKVLPEHLAGDRDRLARFEREAQLLASLNHPHIAAVHGLEQSDGQPALVLELVEGATLDERIANGPLPVEEALAIARQIAEALEAAHEHGIVHRDLKPSNVKVRPDGMVKVLDFGLAKLTASGDANASGSPLSMSPTITSPALTMAGVILGTASYMSPEQARGKIVDRRTDIWAFGCVLFEMLTGRRAFEGGDTISDVVAAILKNDPDWSLLPADVPRTVRTVLRRCLQKDPRKRLPHIGMFRLELDDPADDPPAVAGADRPAWKRAMPLVAVAILASVAVGSAMWAIRREAPAAPVLRFPVVVPGDLFVDPAMRSVAVSPDGGRVAFLAAGRIYTRLLSEKEARPVPGIEFTQGYFGEPVFSPDGDALAYWTGSEIATLKRIAVTGGTPITLARATFPLGTSWGERGIVFAQGASLAPSQIMSVSPDGGAPQTLLRVKDGETPAGPQILPGGDAVIFTLGRGLRAIPDFTQERWDRAQVVVQRLGSGERKVIVDGGSDGRYLPTGHVTYMVGSTMFAVPFDVERLQTTGSAVQILEGVARTVFGTRVSGGSHVSVSASGTLVYLPVSILTATARTVGLIDAQSGQTTRLNLPPGQYLYPRLSPDGERLAVVVAAGTAASIWVYDLKGRTAFRQLTAGGSNLYPVWSPDGKQIAFQSDREGDLAIFVQQVDGGGRPERLTKPDAGNVHTPGAWSPDGKTLLFDVISPGAQGASRTLWSWVIADRKALPFGRVSTNPAFAITPMFSPDGRWVAYTSSSTPVATDIQTYVQPFPPTGAIFAVGGGIHPIWSRDGRQLYSFRPPPEGLGVVTVDTATGFTWGERRPVKIGRIFNRGPNVERENDIMDDGRLIAIVDAAPAAADTNARPSTDYQVVVNWFEELRRHSRK